MASRKPSLRRKNVRKIARAVIVAKRANLTKSVDAVALVKVLPRLKGNEALLAARKLTLICKADPRKFAQFLKRNDLVRRFAAGLGENSRGFAIGLDENIRYFAVALGEHAGEFSAGLGSHAEAFASGLGESTLSFAAGIHARGFAIGLGENSRGFAIGLGKNTGLFAIGLGRNAGEFAAGLSGHAEAFASGLGSNLPSFIAGLDGNTRLLAARPGRTIPANVFDENARRFLSGLGRDLAKRFMRASASTPVRKLKKR